ncbi:MAG TPA: DUF4349 domain-containing protein, partial [Planctomycetota bacterium]
MSHADHEWARELIAAHLAGGLSAEERARLEAHVAGCAECIAEINEAGRFERGLEAAFVPIRPAPGLEERVIRKLRAAPPTRTWGLFGRFLTAAAAAGLLGAVGYVIMDMEDPFQPKIQQSLRDGEWDGYLAKNTRSPQEESAAPPKDAWAEGRAGLKGKDRGRGLDDLRRAERLSDHNESADEDAYRRMKGDSLDFLSDKEKSVDMPNRFGVPVPKPAPPPPPAAEPAPPGETVLALKDLAEGEKLEKRMEQLEEGQSKNFYSYRENAPAKPAELNYFKLNSNAGPGMADNKKLQERLAKAPDAKPEPGKPRTSQQAGIGGETKGGVQGAAPQNDPAPQPVRKIIRSGEVEFEVEGFDTTVAMIQKIAGEERGFIATVNSEKLANGKVRGSVVVRVPPDSLDTLLLKLRALGELKSQRIGSQDVTKAFYDSESRLRAARAMEERLLKIIKDGKGEIKDLLLAEKELGEWRTRIETAEGEIRYYNSQISLSTLTITLQEKEIRAASGVIRTERVDMAVEVEDVEKSHRDALAAIADAKGRVTRSELKQHAAGQLSSVIQFEVAPTASNPLRDRLRQLGTPARMDVNILEENEGGPVRAGAEIRVTQKDSQFTVSIYNLANIQPRETTHLNLACQDAEKTYKDILARIEKAGGRVLTSNLNRQRNDQTTGTIQFE